MIRSWARIFLLVHVALLLLIQIAHAENRIALVIGNGAYQNTPALVNPANDADDMAAALQRVGFSVVFERNLDKRGMERAIARFARAARDADAALFYYAGHGLQHRGSNYLMPTDAKLEDEYSLGFEMTRLDDVLGSLTQARGVKILVLDACRRNPLVERLSRVATTRDFIATRGLARLDATRGMVVAYATQADQVAEDGTTRNSPFTGALVNQIEQPGLEIGTLFRRVAADVHRATNGRQLPELSVSLLGEFYFSRAETDVQAWTKVRASSDPAQLKDFIERYSASPLVTDARERLDAIERAQQARIERERVDREHQRIGQVERQQAERIAQEQQAERERREREQAEIDRLAAEKAKQESTKPTPPIPAGNVQTAMLPPPELPSDTTAPNVLSRAALIREIKKELKRVGCYAGRVDDKWASSETKASIKKFAKKVKIATAPNDPAPGFLDIIREKPERVCPLECTARQIEKDGKCIAKTCPAGSTLNSNGVCEERKEHSRTAARTPTSTRSIDVHTSRKNFVPPKSSKEPAHGAVPTGATVMVDDGTCPRGMIKQIVGGSLRDHIPRTRSCVPR